MRLLEASLSVQYDGGGILTNLQFWVEPGEIVGLAGQSGSGKSTLALSLLRLHRWKGAKAEGSLRFEGRELLQAGEAEWRSLRGRRISLVLQSADSALNPALRLEQQLRLAWRIHEKRSWAEHGLPRAVELLTRCGLPAGAEFLTRYPNQISTGQAQRVLIALALLHRPALLIADEVTSALDMLTREEVLRTLREINETYGTAIIFLSHDLGALRMLCHRIAILEKGTIVETAPTEELFRAPAHPYTQRLLGCL